VRVTDAQILAPHLVDRFNDRLPKWTVNHLKTYQQKYVLFQISVDTRSNGFQKGDEYHKENGEATQAFIDLEFRRVYKHYIIFKKRGADLIDVIAVNPSSLCYRDAHLYKCRYSSFPNIDVYAKET
jgi:hypothetical protein